MRVIRDTIQALAIAHAGAAVVPLETVTHGDRWRGKQPNDALPEYQHYVDTGCEYSPTCLSCELPACRFDLPPKRAGALFREAQLRVLLASGLTADAAAVAMGVSRRTVFRLKRYGRENQLLLLGGTA